MEHDKFNTRVIRFAIFDTMQNVNKNAASVTKLFLNYTNIKS